MGWVVFVVRGIERKYIEMKAEINFHEKFLKRKIGNFLSKARVLIISHGKRENVYDGN